MKPLKAAIAAALLTAAGTVVAPPANAMMMLGNYDVLTNRYNMASWVWGIAACIPEKSVDCVDVTGISRLKYYYEYGGKAHLSGDTYTLVVDVPDGLRCRRPGPALARHLHLEPGHAGRGDQLHLRRRLFRRSARNAVLDLRAYNGCSSHAWRRGEAAQQFFDLPRDGKRGAVL